MMDKEQALHAFWSGFGMPAYDESSVPEDAVMPYITYNVATGSINDVLPLSATLWYRSSSWEAISKKSEEIARRIAEDGFYIHDVDGGYLWLTKGSPFAQRIQTENDSMIRRIYINITAEYLTRW